MFQQTGSPEGFWGNVGHCDGDVLTSQSQSLRWRYAKPAATGTYAYETTVARKRKAAEKR